VQASVPSGQTYTDASVVTTLTVVRGASAFTWTQASRPVPLARGSFTVTISVLRGSRTFDVRTSPAAVCSAGNGPFVVSGSLPRTATWTIRLVKTGTCQVTIAQLQTSTYGASGPYSKQFPVRR
jgi:hypothetical protein